MVASTLDATVSRPFSKTWVLTAKSGARGRGVIRTPLVLEYKHIISLVLEREVIFITMNRRKESSVSDRYEYNGFLGLQLTPILDIFFGS